MVTLSFSATDRKARGGQYQKLNKDSYRTLLCLALYQMIGRGKTCVTYRWEDNIELGSDGVNLHGLKPPSL